MRKHFTAAVLLMLIVITGNSQEDVKAKYRAKREKNLPEIIFERTEYDFGLISFDNDATYKFVFKNTGHDPLVLVDVKASCGCTTPTWSKEPVERKDTSCIKVHYDTKRVGPFQKSIMVYSNAKNSPITLSIKGEVKKPERKHPETGKDDERENTFNNPRRVPDDN